MPLLASLFAGIAFDPHLRGALAVIVGVVVLCGSVYLLLGTNVGARLGLLLSFAGLAGWMVILTLVYWMVPPTIGPKGPSPSWQPIEIFVDGPETPATQAAMTLPQPEDMPSADRILAEHPELGEEYPNGFVLSDLVGSHPEIVDAQLDDADLGGWRLVSSGDAGEAQATAEEALVSSGFFTGPTDFKLLDVFDYGGKPRRTDTCPGAEGGSFLPDEPLCRIWHKIKTTAQLTHPPHYSVVQVQQVITQPGRPGEAPPLPTVDPDAPVVSVVLVRDLGNERMVPALYFVISLALFIFFVLVLHYRDKTLIRNRAEASGVGSGGNGKG